MRFNKPCAGEYGDTFGYRDPITGVVTNTNHTGQDIKAPSGTPVYAAANGTVKRVWWDTFANGVAAGGWMICIDHGDGWETRYAHLREQPTLQPGRWVTTDTVIGIVGATGAATGPHLHFENLRNGVFLDPLDYIGQNGDEDMILNIQGEANKRSGGAWLFKDGVASFLGPFIDGAPHVKIGKTLTNLAKHYRGLPV